MTVTSLMGIGRSISPAAHTDIMFLMNDLPSSLGPLSLSELHLFAYLGNLIAFSEGMPIADWGYIFSITSEGFPFSSDLDFALQMLVRRSVIIQSSHGHLSRGGILFDAELSFIAELTQSSRRELWQKTALACALNLPTGSIRRAINSSPGVEVNLRQGRAAELLRPQDIESIYKEFDDVRAVLGGESHDLLQPAVLWLSARILSEVNNVSPT